MTLRARSVRKRSQAPLKRAVAMAGAMRIALAQLRHAPALIRREGRELDQLALVLEAGSKTR